MRCSPARPAVPLRQQPVPRPPVTTVGLQNRRNQNVPPRPGQRPGSTPGTGQSAVPGRSTPTRCSPARPAASRRQRPGPFPPVTTASKHTGGRPPGPVTVRATRRGHARPRNRQPPAARSRACGAARQPCPGPASTVPTARDRPGAGMASRQAARPRGRLDVTTVVKKPSRVLTLKAALRERPGRTGQPAATATPSPGPRPVTPQAAMRPARPPPVPRASGPRPWTATTDGPRMRGRRSRSRTLTAGVTITRRCLPAPKAP
jgi:hypothetical protein